MNRRPGQVRVTTEVAYCSFCGRPRNLRREEHQLGTLVRTIVTCETCHRTLSSTMGVAAAEPEAAKEQAEPVSEPAPAEETPKPARSAARKPTARKAPASARAKASPAKRTTTKK